MNFVLKSVEKEVSVTKIKITTTLLYTKRKAKLFVSVYLLLFITKSVKPHRTQQTQKHNRPISAWILLMKDFIPPTSLCHRISES